MSRVSKVRHFLLDYAHTYFTVLKLIIPVIIVLKILSYTPLVSWLSWILKPVMGVLGLPGDAGFVIATTMMTSIYSGMLAWNSLSTLHHLTVAQATTITAIMLFAHTLFIELQITKKAGVSKRISLLWRVGGAFLFGYLIHYSCTSFHLLSSPAHMVFKPNHVDITFMDWGVTQFLNVLKIGAIIFGLMLLMRVLRTLKITNFLETILRPFFTRIGISRPAISLSIIGLVLGLFYGGALIIREANEGVLSRSDVFFSIAFLNLCHSIIEDSILGTMMGGNVYVLVIGRLLFSYIAVWGIYKATPLLLSFQRGRLQSETL